MRTQTFSGPTRPPPLATSSQRQPVTGQEDSLPNSPTYFAELQKLQNQERDTPSPSTKIVNLHFQEHLDQLGQRTRKPKSKVLDWIHESNSDGTSGRDLRQDTNLGRSENRTKKASNPDVKSSGLETSSAKEPDTVRMKRDYKAELPSQSYHKKTPIYASLDEPDADFFSAVAIKSSDNEPDLLEAIQNKVNIPVLTSAVVPPTQTAPVHSRVTRTNSTPAATVAPGIKTPPGYPPRGIGSTSRPGTGTGDNRARPRLPTDTFVQRHSARYPHQRPASGSRVRTTSEDLRVRSAQQARPSSSMQSRSGSFAAQGDRMGMGIGMQHVQARPGSSSHPHSGRPPLASHHFKSGQPHMNPLPTQLKANSGQVTATFGKDYYILDV